jgi:hypothetical protein
VYVRPDDDVPAVADGSAVDEAVDAVDADLAYRLVFVVFASFSLDVEDDDDVLLLLLLVSSSPVDCTIRSAVDNNASTPGKGYKERLFRKNFAARSYCFCFMALAPITLHRSASSLLTSILIIYNSCIRIRIIIWRYQN